jgi:PAS domain S-box-containing protein
MLLLLSTARKDPVEDEFSRVVNALPGLIWIALPKGNVDFVNRYWCEYTGIGMGGACGVGWQTAIHPKDLPELLERWQSIIVSGEPGEMEARLRRFDGEYRWFVFAVNPMRDEAGQILRWYGLNSDIEDRMRAKEDLHAHQGGSFLSIGDGIPALISFTSPTGEIESVNRHYLEYFGITLDEAKSWGTNDMVHPAHRQTTIDSWRRSVQTGKTFDVEHRVRRADGVYRWFQSRGLPLKDVEGRIVSWFVTATDIDDRKLAEEALRNSERNFRKIVDSIPGLVCTLSPTGEVEQLNRPLLEYFGKASAELKGWKMTDAVHPEDLPRIVAAFTDSVTTGTPYDVEHRCRRFDGIYRWFQVRALPVQNSDGQVAGWYVLLTDIEDLKQAEESLESGELDLRSVINTIPMTAWSTEADGYCDFVNQRWLDYSGLSLEQVRGWGWSAVIHPDDLADLVGHWQSCLASGASVNTEARMRRFDGVYRWFLFLGNALRDESGDIVKWFGTNVDIEDRKESDEALRTSARNLDLIINTIPMLAWSTGPDGFVEFLNKRWLDYAGMSAEEGAGWGWAAVIHPEDAKGLLDYWQAAMASGTDVDVEARMRRFDGVYRWFLFRASPLRDEMGNIVKWYGTNVDIEDRKRSDEALRANERNLRQLTETIPEMLWSATSEGAIDYCSGRLLDYTGFTPDEIMGANWTKLLHPDDVDRTAREWMSCITTGAPYRVEVRTFHAADRNYRWCETKALPLLDQEGRILKWHGTVVDTHDRKRIEEELRRSEAFLAEGQRLNLSGSFSWRLDTDEVVFTDQLYPIFEFERRTPVTLERVASRLHPEDVQLMYDKIALAREGQSDISYEIRLRMSNGSIKYLRAVAHATRDQEGQMELVGAIQDVTERRLSEEALGKVRSELARMARVASLGALTASIAHEVSQPLSGIITNANTGLRMLGAVPPNVDGTLETVRRTLRDGNRASEVISKLRSLFTKKDFTAEIVDLNEATREVIALLMSELQRSRLMLRIQLADDLPPVMGDRIQLQQIILNLLLNASEAMTDVDNRSRHIVVTTERDGVDSVRFTVQDVGVGLDPQNMEQLFDAFYTTKNGGMGMGLSVSRSIIESHHGRLWALPNDGPGATFAFSLPRAPEGVGVIEDDDLGSIQRSALNTMRSVMRDL